MAGFGRSLKDRSQAFQWIDAAKDAIERKVTNPAARGSAGDAAKKANAAAIKASSQKKQTQKAAAAAAASTPSSSGYSFSGGGAAADPDDAMRNTLKAAIKGKAGAIEAIYNALFGDLDNLVRTRDAELTTQYGGQRTKATEQYTDALPEIDQSYASIGSYDSTQRGDSRGKAKKGYEDTLTTIGQNEKADRDKLGAYRAEQAAKFTADRDSARRNIGRVDETTDVGALRGLRNDLESNLDTAGVTRASLGTNGSQTLQQLTGDNGRAEAATNALDSIIKSSLGSDVKAAAVKAVVDSAGLSDEDKKKVQATYGNVYAEQAAL